MKKLFRSPVHRQITNHTSEYQNLLCSFSSGSVVIRYPFVITPSSSRTILAITPMSLHLPLPLHPHSSLATSSTSSSSSSLKAAAARAPDSTSLASDRSASSPLHRTAQLRGEVEGSALQRENGTAERKKSENHVRTRPRSSDGQRRRFGKGARMSSAWICMSRRHHALALIGHRSSLANVLLRSRHLGPTRGEELMNGRQTHSAATCRPVSIENEVITFDNSFLTAEKLHPRDTLAVIALNNKALSGCRLFPKLWTRAAHRLCADGGANRLFDRFFRVPVKTKNEQQKEEEEDREARLPLPTAVKGDLDSLRDDVREFFEAQAVPIIRDGDQDRNDLDKCLQHLQDLGHQKRAESSDESVSPEARKGAVGSLVVVIFGAFGGRFDQEMQSINALYRWHARFDRIVLLSDETMAFLIPRGRSIIRSNFLLEGRSCGLIPVGTACADIRTTGLMWNLNSQRMAFGELVSTSNRVLEEADHVYIESSDPLIWTTEIVADP